MKINGETKLVGIIGYPLKHTYSPFIFNGLFDYYQLNWAYVPLPVLREENLPSALNGIRALNFVGVNVTMPYKEAVISYLDELDTYAQMVKAINVIHVQNGKLIGYNTDGKGFLNSLERDANFYPKGKSFLIIGAGGGARAICLTLAMEEPKRIIIANRTPEKAKNLRDMVKENFPSVQVDWISLNEPLAKIFKDVEVVINATPVGMGSLEGEMPISREDWEGVTEKHLVCDLIYYPEETKFLKTARERGAQTLNGLGMLIFQGIGAFKVWTGLEPPAEIVKRIIDKELSLVKSGA